MQCKNHPAVTAVERCAGCAEPFCPDCLIEIRGQKYCGSCKVLAVQGQPPALEEASMPCKEADEALKYALVGIICFGIILEPVAFAKALKARKMIAANPRLTGSGKVTAALVISSALFLLNLLWLLAILAKAGR